jgi:hypothetical protein
MDPALSTKYVFTITANIGSVVSAGDIGHGVRRVFHFGPRRCGNRSASAPLRKYRL